MLVVCGSLMVLHEKYAKEPWRRIDLKVPRHTTPPLHRPDQGGEGHPPSPLSGEAFSPRVTPPPPRLLLLGSPPLLHQPTKLSCSSRQAFVLLKGLRLAAGRRPTRVCVGLGRVHVKLSGAYLALGWAKLRPCGLCWAHLEPMLSLCWAYVGLC